MFYKELLTILELAQRAPSGDNIQPWKVFYKKRNLSKIEIFYDIQKEDFFNFENRATFVSCGCYLKTLEIAATGFGYSTIIKFDDSSSKRIATIHFKKSLVKQSLLFPSITKRITNRNAYDSSKFIDKKIIHKLNEVVKKFNLTLNHIKKEQKNQVDDLCFKVEQIKIENWKAISTIFNSVKFEEKPKTGLDFRSLNLGKSAKITSYLLRKKKLVSFFKVLGISKKIAKETSYDLTSNTNDLFFLTGNVKMTKKNLVSVGMCIQEVWLELTSKEYTMQPFVNFSFMLQRFLHKEHSQSYSQEEQIKLKNIISLLYSTMNLDIKKDLPLFFFRAGIPLSDTVKTYRKNIEDIIVNE